jgi:hypothetical protein
MTRFLFGPKGFPWAVVVIWVSVFIFALVGCASGGGDDDDDDDDDVNDDDDDSDDDDDAIDPGDPVDFTIEPHGEAVPVGASEKLDAIVTYDTGIEIPNPGSVDWVVGDETLAEVNAGLTTGLLEGFTTLTAYYDEDEFNLYDSVDLFIGPDVYFIETDTRKFGVIDRVAGAYVEDYIGGKGAIADVPVDLHMFGRFVLVTDAADTTPGITGNERVQIVNVPEASVITFDLTLDTPAAAIAYGDYVWVSGRHSDSLARWDHNSSDVDIYDMAAGCGPTYLAGANGYIYVSCSGNSTVAVIDEEDSILTVAVSRSEPGRILATADERNVYVVSNGTPSPTTGAVDRIETDYHQVVNTIDIGATGIGDASMGRKEKLYLVDGPNVLVVDTDNNDQVVRGDNDPVVIGTATSALSGILAHPDTDELYVSHRNLSSGTAAIEVYNTSGFSLIASYPLTGQPGDLAAW